MAKRINSTPKADGYRMPGEFEKQKQIWMLWPERPDNWRDGAKPAQKTFVEVAKAISQFEPVTMCASKEQYQNARAMLPEEIRVVEIASNDAWIRDCGPTFVVNDKGGIRGCDWAFNAWGGLTDGLYFPWDQDDLVARKVCEIEGIDTYHTPDFVFEGGSFHVDGEGTLMTTEQCLLSEGRNPHMSREEIEQMMKNYLNLEKIIWVKEGIDPDETNGHVDDVCCFVSPGVAVTIWTEDENDPFYQICQDAYKTLCEATDAKGRKLLVHKLCMPKVPVTIQGSPAIDAVEGTIPRENGDLCAASYMNYLVVNGGVIVPQYGDENDALALEQLQALYPQSKVVGVQTREVVFGGGNIHCITQQQPATQK